MANENLKGITVKVNGDLHAEVKKYIEDHGMTWSEYVEKALENEIHQKHNNEEVQTDMRTIAFQVSEELYQKLKDYLKKHKVTQKDLMCELVEKTIEQDQAVSLEKTEAKELEGVQGENPADEEFAADPDESEEMNPDEDDIDEGEGEGITEDEDEDMGMSLGM